MTANHFIPIPYIIDIGRCCVIKAYQKNYRCKIKRYNCFPFLCSRFSVFCYFRFLFLLLFFFHPSHHKADLSHLLSLGDLSSPYHNAAALFWFSPQCSFFLITTLFPPPRPSPSVLTHPVPPTLFLSLSLSVTSLLLLHYFHRSFSLSHRCTHLRHSFTLFPSVCVEVEPFVGMPRRRPLSLCPCCSPEGNVTSPPRLTVVAGYHGNRKDLQNWASTSRPSPSSSHSVLLLYLSSPFFV